MGRPCADRPSVSVCTGTGTGATGRSVGTARIALGDSNGEGAGAEGEASREADGDGVPVARGGAPLVAVAVGGAVVARAAGAPALAGRLPPQAGATSALAASARQIGGRTNMMVPYPRAPRPHTPIPPGWFVAAAVAECATWLAKKPARLSVGLLANLRPKRSCW